MIDTTALFLTLTAFFALLPSVILQWRFKLTSGNCYWYRWLALPVFYPIVNNFSTGMAGGFGGNALLYIGCWLGFHSFCAILTVFTWPCYIYSDLLGILFYPHLPLTDFQGPARPFLGQVGQDVFIHILFAVISYILLTHSAIIGVVMLWKQYLIKRGKNLMTLRKTQPFEGEHIIQRFMLVAFLLLIIDVIMSVTINYREHGRFFFRLTKRKFLPFAPYWLSRYY